VTSSMEILPASHQHAICSFTVDTKDKKDLLPLHLHHLAYKTPPNQGCLGRHKTSSSTFTLASTSLYTMTRLASIANALKSTHRVENNMNVDWKEMMRAINAFRCVSHPHTSRHL
jgi:hypothetical protein